MRTWMADLSGLLIGFALGGAALVYFLPQIQQAHRAALATAQPAPPPVTLAPETLAPVTRLPPARAAPVRPAEPEPSIAVVLTPEPAPLPTIVHPEAPDTGGARPAPGTGQAGTGFFVGDSLLMTAAHVVTDCQRMEIVSQFIPVTPATLLARDAAEDIALLSTPRVIAPAVLGIGRPATGGGRVFVLGYPASAGPRVAAETWGTLENDKLPHEPVMLTDPRETVWMEALDVTHGYSGGPIFDPRTGLVVGIVRGLVDGTRLRAVRGMPVSGIAIGPGSARLTRFLQDEAPGMDALPASRWGEDPLAVVRRATVHVLCWH